MAILNLSTYIIPMVFRDWGFGSLIYPQRSVKLLLAQGVGFRVYICITSCTLYLDFQSVLRFGSLNPKP